MPCTAEQTRLASRIDNHVTQVLANGGDDADLLHSLYDYMGTFKQLMDMSTPEEMQRLCEHYSGFHRFAALLERLAEGIADGSIPVPE